MSGLDALQHEVGEWGDRTFRASIPWSVTCHLQDEAAELEAVENPNEETWAPEKGRLEAADCFLLLLHYAHKRGFSLAEATREKFEINKARRWGTPDERGVVRHVEVEA